MGEKKQYSITTGIKSTFTDVLMVILSQMFIADFC